MKELELHIDLDENRNRQDSLFHEGLIAETENHEVVAHGEIKIVQDGTLIYDGKNRNGGQLETDKDIEALYERQDVEFVSTNWYAVRPKDNLDDAAVLGTLSEALYELLRQEQQSGSAE